MELTPKIVLTRDELIDIMCIVITKYRKKPSALNYIPIDLAEEIMKEEKFGL